MNYPQSTLPPRWWETAAAIGRPYLRQQGQTLHDLTARLDAFKASGISALEVFAVCKGGVCYGGLDTLDYYEVDPALGTMADFKQLIDEAHQRQIAIVAFVNLGYGHEQFPAFLKACDDVRAGIESAETRYFVWSDTGEDKMDRSLAPYFMNDSHGNWRWSDRAQKYFWVKWEGEHGGYHLPQFNFGDPGWQGEVRRIVDFWLQTGIDGLIIDAVNWYIDCNWAITRYSMTDLLNTADNQLTIPEGAGGFNDYPVPWISEGRFNCVMDYAIDCWWENHSVIRDAIQSGDPRPIEAALGRYRDPVVAAGGVCYINPPLLEGASPAARILGIALVATMGELFVLHGEEIDGIEPPEVGAVLHQLLEARQRYPALCAGGRRVQFPTQDDGRFYAYQRTLTADDAAILVVLNFQPTPQKVRVQIAGGTAAAFADIWSDQIVQVTGGTAEFDLPAYGFGIYQSLAP